MRWSPLRIVTAPTAELPLSAVREYVGVKSDQTNVDGLLDRIRASVVADAEYYMRRAVYPQRRAFTGYVDGYYERPRRVFRLERFRGDTPPGTAPATATTDVQVNGAARAHERQGDAVQLTEFWQPRRGDEIEITYDAGFDVLPPDLLEALLQECQRRYERVDVPRGGDSRSPAKLSVGATLCRWRAGNEPLVNYLVEVGAGQ